MSTDHIEDHPDGERRPQLRALPGGNLQRGTRFPTGAAGVCGCDGARRQRAAFRLIASLVLGSHPRYAWVRCQSK